MKASAEYWQASLGAREQPKPGAARESTLPETLEQIYDKHFDFVWRNARRLGVPEVSADDIVQDVFMVVQRRLSVYDGRAPMQSWLFGILIRVVAAHRRSYRRKAARNVPFDQSIDRELTAALSPTPVEQFERGERAEFFANVLGQIDEDKRALLILSELEDWTLREIAELYQSNINTIYSRLRAAKRAFERAYLQAQADAPAKDGAR